MTGAEAVVLSGVVHQALTGGFDDRGAHCLLSSQRKENPPALTL